MPVVNPLRLLSLWLHLSSPLSAAGEPQKEQT